MSATVQPVPAIEARGIDKRFDGVHALKGARLDVRSGEIHALLGENGAGKSTMIKVLTGLYDSDAGTIWRDGEEVAFANVRAANRAGVVALYQELSIIPSLTVAENILLGEQTPRRAGIVQWGALRKQAREPTPAHPSEHPARQARRRPLARSADHGRVCPRAGDRCAGPHSRRAHGVPDRPRDHRTVRGAAPAPRRGRGDSLRLPPSGRGVRAVRPAHHHA